MCHLIIILGAFLGIAYLEAPLWVWSSFCFLVLLSVKLSLFWFFVFAIALGAFITMFNVSKNRKKFILPFVYQRFKKVLPSMSVTEREALAAGDVWWEGELFQGRPNWHTLLSIPKPLYSEEEARFLNNQVNHLCAMIDDWQISHVTLDLPEAVWTYLKKEKFFGMNIPKEYGGLGFSALGHSTVVQKIATHSLTAAITTMVPNSLGPAELLLHYGTEVQKQYYLPRLAEGIEIPCFALTGPLAGSDAGAIPDKAVICRGMFEGKEIIGMKLSWDKRYITLAPVATLMGLAVKLFDPEGLLGGAEERGITLLLIKTTHPGVEIGKRHFPMNQAFMNGPTRGQDVFVPLDWIIGGEENIGKGWRMLVECLSAGRGISMPALSVAGSKLGYRVAGAYALVRKQFNTSIGRFGGVEEVLASIGGLTYLLEAARVFTLSGIMTAQKPSLATAIAKCHMTEIARSVAMKTMDILAGRGIMLGPKNFIGRWYEGVPISITVEGANILTRNLIIFGQGVMRCHPFIQEEMKALYHEDEEEGIALFDQTLSLHVRYALGNFARLTVHGLSGGFFCDAPKGVGAVKRYYKQLSRMSLALSFVSDIALLILGGSLKKRERLSARLGDVLSYLYFASAVLKYYQDFGHKEEDEVYVNWSLQYCLFHIQEAFIAFFKNFPNKFLAWFLRGVLFPFGRVYSEPTDRLEHAVAEKMMQPSSFRERLTQHCYLGDPKTNAVAELENTFQEMITLSPTLSKLEHSIKSGLIPKKADVLEKIRLALSKGVLTENEAENLLRLEEACRKVIAVDEFSKEEL